MSVNQRNGVYQISNISNIYIYTAYQGNMPKMVCIRSNKILENKDNTATNDKEDCPTQGNFWLNL